MSYTPLKKIAELQAEIATLRAELKARNEQIAYPEASEDQLRQSKAVMYRELEAVKGRCGELEAENAALAAGQCSVKGGLLGDEGGTPYCSLRRHELGI